MVHSGNADAVESLDDEDRFIKWSTVVVPMVISLEVVLLRAHSPKAKKTSYGQEWWCRSSTFTNGQGKLLHVFFNDAVHGTFNEDGETSNGQEWWCK